MGHRPVTTKGKELLAAADAAAVRTAASLGSIATQDASSVSISGGTISGVGLSGDDQFNADVTEITASTTLGAGHYAIVANHASTPIVLTLPSATGSGRRFTVKRVGAAAVSVVRAGSDMIDGANSYALESLESITLVDLLSGAWGLV